MENSRAIGTSRDRRPGRLAAEAGWARTWLFESAFPLWAETGYDRKREGFVERIGKDGQPLEIPRRGFVQLRQLYSFAEAGRLGWTGPWRDLVERGSEHVLKRYIRDDGLIRTSVHPDGSVANDDVDNYVQGFALLGFASVFAVTGDERFRTAAHRVHAALGGRRHAVRGYHETEARDGMLKSNPHMHLLEGMLAWIALGDRDWVEPAGQIVALLRERLVDEAFALREFFDGDWAPYPGEAGRIVEPGHNFEWAWLLDRYAAMVPSDEGAAVVGLFDFAQAHGIDAARGATVNEIWTDGRLKDGGARLWPQTERLKAALSPSVVAARGDQAIQAAVEAFTCLKTYLEDPAIPGLWHDRYEPDGSFRDAADPALASSLYHITCAMAELIRFSEER